jgi:type I restriction enzyme S subunit
MRFYKETNFKDTEIGRIPKDWEVVRLGQVLTYIKGKKPEKMVEEYREDYLPYLSTDYLRENKTTIFAKPSNDMIVVDDGDLILLWDGSNAGEFFFGKRGIVSSTMAKIELKEKNIDKSFFFYLLKTKESFLKGQTRGTGIPHVDACVLTNILVSLPPLSEQHKIAEILSMFDKAIQKTNEIIAKTERLKKGLMEELLTKGIGHKEFKDTEIGRIPKEWEVVSLEDVSLKIRTGPFGSQLKKSELSESGLKVYTQENILKSDFSLGNLYIRYEKFERLKTMEVKPGDVLLTIRGSTGYSAVFPEGAERGIIHTNLAYVRVKRSLLLPKYLSLLINDYPLVKSQVTTFSSATTLGALYAKSIKKIIIPLPPLQEQLKITEIFSAINKKLEIEKNEKAKLERIKQGMMDLLLTGKIRVKVA